MSITIDSAFDSGNIIVSAVSENTATLEIRKDKDSDFYQWFHFRVTGARGRALTLNITNCAESAYPGGWSGYQVRYSTNRQDWMCAQTQYAQGVLTISHTPDSDVIWFAYFAPYSMERHHDLIARMASKLGVHVSVLGHSVDGQPIDYVQLGTGTRQAWFYCRQHPGESMAEYWAEGALEFLTSDNSVAERLRDECTFHIIPNMNPDGSRRGHLRTNSVGVNLNREWATPTEDKSPEVLCVRNMMDKTGVDFAMDVHGDEAIPANFIAGFEGIPNWSDAQGAAYYDFRNRLTAHTPEFQDKLGYHTSAPGKANLTMSTNQIANRFGAVAMTLEMPFKDHDPNPNPERAWSPERCKDLAHRCLEVWDMMIRDGVV